MTATPADFVAQTAFEVREDTPQDNLEINIHRPGVQDPVPSPMFLADGMRFSITHGSHVDYYRVHVGAGVSPVGQIVAGGVDWASVGVSPKTVRAYTAGDAIRFVPYAAITSAVPEVRVKRHELATVRVFDHVTMIGGRDRDLSAVALGGSAIVSATTTRASVTASPVVNFRGLKEGVATVVVRVSDKHQGRVSLSVRVRVLPANRAPRSIKALGNPTVGVGATQRYDLTDYFEDPDGDALNFVVSGQNANVTASLSGTDMTVRGVGADSVTLDITASDPAGLSVSQQMYVTVPVNRRPVRIGHVDAVALEVGGQTVSRRLADYFQDPDAGALTHLVQWEEGDATRQYAREFWHVGTVVGTNLLRLRSLYTYPVQQTSPPWGSGQAWVVPPGEPLAIRQSGGTVIRSTVLSSPAPASWVAPSSTVGGYVAVAIRTSTDISGSEAGRLLFGSGADVGWIAPLLTVDTVGAAPSLDWMPGGSKGARTAYVRVWDAGGLDTSDLFGVSLSDAPSTVAIPDQSVFAGSDLVVRLDDHFSDPAGGVLTYAVAESAPHIVTQRLVSRQVVTPGTVSVDTDLHVHGVTAGQVTLTVTATNVHGLTASLSVAVVVRASAVAGSVTYSIVGIARALRREFVPGLWHRQRTGLGPRTLAYVNDQWSTAGFNAVTPEQRMQFAVYDAAKRIIPVKGDAILVDGLGPFIVKRAWAGGDENAWYHGDDNLVTIEFTAPPQDVVGISDLVWYGPSYTSGSVSHEDQSAIEWVVAPFYSDQPIELAFVNPGGIVVSTVESYASTQVAKIPPAAMQDIDGAAGDHITVGGFAYEVTALGVQFVSGVAWAYIASLAITPLLYPLLARTMTWSDGDVGALPAVTRGTAYSFEYSRYRRASVSDGSPVTYAASGLPAGLGMSAVGLVSGTTTAPVGSYPVTVTASAVDRSVSETATFVVS